MASIIRQLQVQAGCHLRSNLQNIPIRTQQGRKVRDVARPGHTLICDYSQIELRIMAHF